MIDKYNYTVALTTSDNPYSPFEDFDKWYAEDVARGYNSCAYLARIAKVSSEMTDLDYLLEVERAIDEIVEFNLTGREGVSFVKLKVPLTA